MTIAQTFAPDQGQRQPATPRRPRLDPLRAVRGLRRLIADKDDTGQVFEIMRALSGRSFAKGYARMLRTPEGGRQAYLRDEFADRLHDVAWLETLPSGSVGAVYRDFVGARAISAYGLAEESRKTPDVNMDAAHPMAWYVRRLRDVHDVWHVLTGYGTDTLGEACLVAFSFAQTRNAGFAFIAAGAAWQFEKPRVGQPYAKAIAQAWAHGRRAAWLPALDYEILLTEPLDAARSKLGIRPPTIYDAVPAGARDVRRSDGQSSLA
ncbi:MAG: Coq4 family protein [Pseudomonadota bacterium]